MSVSSTDKAASKLSTGKLSTSPLATTSSAKAFSSPAYHELLENPHIEIDGLQRLNQNLAQLEDLHGRLKFLMKDVAGLLRRR